METIKNAVSVFGDKLHLLWAGLLTGVVVVVSDQTFMFRTLGFFLILNVVDFYYGRKKAKETETLNSKVGAKGISKKVSYWVVIGVAFYMSSLFIDLGAKIGINTQFMTLFGWFVLITYMLNEITSIVENLVILGYNVPDIFIKGLNAIKHNVNTAGEKEIPKE